MPYANTRELKEDVLFRASEPVNGSDWDGKAVEYLNRVYRSLCTGASEFLPEYVEDWWWMRGRGVLLLEPTYLIGTVAVVQGNTGITFDPAPAASMVGYRLKIDEECDIPQIISHVGGFAAATLDAAWTGSSGTFGFKLFKIDYTLPIAVQALTAPITVFDRPETISGMAPERMDIEYPLARLESGMPQAYSLETENQIRFSHGGSEIGFQYRLEYRYRAHVADLTDSPSSIPLVPAQYRHMLSDMALTYVLIDKNDDRSNAVALGARTALAGMIKDNRRRNVKIDKNVGHIYTRPGKMRRRVLSGGGT